MATTQIAATPAERLDYAEPVEGTFFSRTLEHVRQAWCGLHGHDTLLNFERDRMFLRCVSCGHESPGWDVGEQNCRPDFRAAHERARVATPHMIGARKIA
jgi:hypothetical protein